MLIAEFAKYLKANNSKHCKPSILTLTQWLRLRLESPCVSNIDKILHREILLATNERGCFFFIAKSDSGRVLLKALYNFCEYYDNYKKAKKIITCRKSK